MRKAILLFAAAIFAAAEAVAQAPVPIQPTDQIVDVSIPEINSNFTLLYNTKAATADCSNQNGTVLVTLGATASSCRSITQILGYTPVQSFNLRGGPVMPATGDYSFSMISGQVGIGQLPGSVPLNNQPNSFIGSRQSFGGTSTGAALSVIPSVDPTSPSQGDLWFGNVSHRFRYYDGSAVQTVAIVGDTIHWSQIPDAPSFEPAITGGLSSQYWAGNKVWRSFQNDVLSLFSATGPITFVNGVIACPTCGTGSGGGISSIGVVVPPQFGVSGSPLTQNGNISISWNNAPANQFFGGQDNATGQPLYRAIVKRDLPSLTSGSGLLKGDGSGFFSAGTADDVIALFAGCAGTMYPGADGSCHTAGTGTVTNVGLVLPNIFIGGSSVTTSGNLSASLANQNATYAWMGPAYGQPAAPPSFRAITMPDLPASVVATNQANTYGNYLQDLTLAKLIPPMATVAGLPAAASSTNQIYLVTNGASQTDCTVGGGTNPVWCRASAGVWTPLGGGGSGSGTVASAGAQQLAVYENAGATVSGLTPTGDATINFGTGVITVRKTGGAPFAASATTDTTNAANITAGTLPAQRLPASVVQNNQANAYGANMMQDLSVARFKPAVSLAASLPSATGLQNAVYLVTDGQDSSDCGGKGGGGATSVWCRSNGTAWVAVNGGGGSGAVNTGATGQLGYYADNGAAISGFTLVGDCTLTAPNITCSKTGGVAFAPSATTDTTNAANILSGVLNALRIPNSLAFSGLSLTNNQTATTALPISNANAAGGSELQLFNDQAVTAHAGFTLAGSTNSSAASIYNGLGRLDLIGAGDTVFKFGSSSPVEKARVYQSGGLSLAYGNGGSNRSGFGVLYVDSTSKVGVVQDDTGAQSTTIRAKDCSGVGHISKINSDGTVACSADGGVTAGYPPVVATFDTGAGTCSSSGGTSTNSCSGSSGSVVIVHNLGTSTPQVTVYSASVETHVTVTANSANQITLSFVGNLAGSVSISTGGIGAAGPQGPAGQNGTVAQIQVNGTGLSNAGTVNFQNSNSVQGVQLTWANPSDGNIKPAISGVAGTAADNAYTGANDFSSASHLVVKKGLASAAPATCTVGELYFATDAPAGQNLNLCTAPHTWSPESSGSGGGLALVEQHTANNSGSIVLSGFNSTYDQYQIELLGMLPSVAAGLKMYVSNDGGATWQSTGYSWSYWQVANNNTTTNESGQGASALDSSWALSGGGLSTSGLDGFDGELKLFNMLTSGRFAAYTYQAYSSYESDGNSRAYEGAGRFVGNSNSVNAIKFAFDSGANISSGTVRLYGLAKTSTGGGTGTTGGGSSVDRIWIPTTAGTVASSPLSLPTANAPSPNPVIGTNTVFAVLSYANGSRQTAFGNFPIPSAAPSSMTLELKWRTADTTTSDTIAFDWSYACSSTTGDPTLASAGTINANPVSSANQWTTSTVTLASPACNPGDQFIFSLSHRGDTDSVTAPVDVASVRIHN